MKKAKARKSIQSKKNRALNHQKRLEAIAKKFTQIEGKKTQITIGNARELAKALVADVTDAMDSDRTPLVSQIGRLGYDIWRDSEGNILDG